MNKELMFSSENDSWETPQYFFDKLNEEFNFTLDPCATHENHKCDKYYTIEDNGLSKDWSNEIVFMNPPYSKPENPCKPNCNKKGCQKRGYHIDKYKPGQEDWIKKAYEESQKGTIVIALLPSRTDTKFFHKYIYNKMEIRFIEGRLKFSECEDSAPFPSMIVVFKKIK